MIKNMNFLSMWMIKPARLKNKKKQGQKAFTLLELIIVLGILGIILVLLSNILRYGIRNMMVEDNTIEYRHNARTAVDLMVRELEEARDKNPEIGESEEVTLTLSGSSIIYAHPWKNNIIVDATGTSPKAIGALVWFYQEPGSERGKIVDREGAVRADNILTVNLTESAISSESAIFISVRAGRSKDGQNTVIYQREVKKTGR
jgi:prepilin-type N-terminal cleavage/methylation domain-containing protein